MSQQGIKVGVFSDHCDEGPVPTNLIGKQIWYSYERREYWIIDDDHKFINKFYAVKFAQFVKINAIIFASDTVRSEMINEANRVLAGGAATTTSTGSPPVVPQAPQMQSSVPPMSAPVPRAMPQPTQYVPPQQVPPMVTTTLPYNTGATYNAPPLPGQWGQQQQMYTPSVPPVMQQPSDAENNIPELINQGAEEHRPSKARDPSRHLFGFFLTCAILTAVVMTIILFGESLVASVSTLLN